MAEPYGTIAKYRNAFAIKKHNAIVQPWASAMALDVAAVFWATWKGVEERLPEGDEILEAEKPRDSRDLKNKYSAIIRVEVKRHSAELQRVIENYIYRVWLAGAVEQCRDLGCTGWFFSSLSKSSTSSESASAPDGTSLQEAPKVRNVKADKSGWVSLPNLRAQEYAKKHAAEAVTQINDTTRKEIARIVSDGVKSGSSYNDIAKAIKDKFKEFAVPMPQKHIPNRAVLVAVTELANAYCEGNAQVGNYLQDNGVKMMKAWQTLEDDRVSDGCRENESVGWIPINKEFPSGHMHPPRFPGCRCDFLQDILEEDYIGKSIKSLYGKQYENSKVASKKLADKGTSSVGRPKYIDAKTLESMEKVSGKTEYLDSVVMYTDGFYDALNDYMTTGSISDQIMKSHEYDWDFGQDKAEVVEYCKYWSSQLNKMCLETKLPNGGSVFRLDQDGYDYEVGETFSYGGYTSTSVSKDWLEKGDEEFDPSEMKDRIRIDIPAGMNSVGTYFGKNSTYPEQKEFLMNAGTKYQVVSKKPNENGGYDWVWKVVG